MTLAMATFLQGLLVIIAGGSAVSVQNPLVAWLGIARPARHSGGHPAVARGLGGGAGRCCTARRSARAVFALGTNPLAARLSGVDVGRDHHAALYASAA